MPISDFLNNGQIPAGSAATSTTTQNVLPEWYTNYAMQLLSNQQAVAQTPYQTYQGPRVAEFSPMQQQAFGQVPQAAQAYQPGLAAATQSTQAALNAPGGLAGAQPYFGQAAGMSGVNAAQPQYTQALSTINAGVDTNPLNVAQPYLAQAGQRATDVSAYMNPYTQQVVDRIGELGARNLSEKIMPAITGRYINAGQLGFGGRDGAAGTPSGMMTDTARAVRDVSADILAQQAQALQGGYTQAQGAAQADLARQATLASTAGNLGSAQQQALLEAAQQQAGIGTNLGSLTQAQQRILADLGSNVGTLTNADLNRQLAGAQQMGALSEMAQTLGLRGADAMQQAGALQQAQAQKNLDTAYADFLKQQAYNQEQIDRSLATFKGVAPGIPTATTKEGIEAAGQNQPSTASQIGGGLAGAAALLSAIGKL